MDIIERDGTTRRHAVVLLQRPASPLRLLLLPMIHVGVPDFYAHIRDRLATCGLIVAEGVGGGSWQVRALTLGARMMARSEPQLVEQDNDMLLPPGVPVVHADCTAAEVAADLRAEFGRLRGPLLAAGAAVGAVVLPIAAPGRLLRAAVAPPRPSHTADRAALALTTCRAERLCAALEEIHREHGEHCMAVGVLYGAEHMTAVLAWATGRGYQVQETEWLTAMVVDRPLAPDDHRRQGQRA